MYRFEYKRLPHPRQVNSPYPCTIIQMTRHAFMPSHHRRKDDKPCNVLHEDARFLWRVAFDRDFYRIENALR